ncbi:hypothetical protein BKA64DRAFT_771988 [Cadophora sp. MPI-SDFR-AT-0126]|nr:hypothetical protein BKA64DRAFT_771988 [Leotiomycetes sp. MPI-SDFR-AT-0126]
MSNQSATLLRAMLSNLLGRPFGNIEIFPSYSTEPSQEIRTLNRICIATAWFVFCVWAMNKLGWWNHMAGQAQETEILVQEEEHEQDENEFIIQETYEEQRQQLHHDLETEAHLARTTTYFFLWNDLISPNFILAIILSRWSYSFYSFASTYSVMLTWENYCVFMFGELGWWDVGTVVSGIVAWVVLHLGELMDVQEEMEFHVWVDGVGRRLGAWVGEVVAGGVREVFGVAMDGGRSAGSMLRGSGLEREGNESERDWSAWDVEERERRELGLPVRALRGGWRVRI